MSKLTQWEAHMCVIRGEIISQATAIKKEKQTRLKDIFTKLKSLEATHRCTLAHQTYLELTEVCTLLQEKLGRNLKKKYTHYHKKYFMSLVTSVDIY